MKTTKDAGLTAGKYYTLKTGETTGSADNSLGETIGWVQLWPGGPKFATENVAKTLNWSEATAKGSAYVWGANWRTPTKEEMNFVNVTPDPEVGNILNPLNTKAEFKVQDGKPGFLYTGIQPGYTDKTIFLPSQDGVNESYFHACYWSSTVINGGYGVSLDFYGGGGVLAHYKFNEEARTSPGTEYLVRPVLAE